jgi:hypothetical protein
MTKSSILTKGRYTKLGEENQFLWALRKDLQINREYNGKKEASRCVEKV